MRFNTASHIHGGVGLSFAGNKKRVVRVMLNAAFVVSIRGKVGKVFKRAAMHVVRRRVSNTLMQPKRQAMLGSPLAQKGSWRPEVAVPRKLDAVRTSGRLSGRWRLF